MFNWSSLMSSMAPMAKAAASTAKKPGMWQRLGTGLARGVSSQYDPEGFASYKRGGAPSVDTGGSLTGPPTYMEAQDQFNRSRFSSPDGPGGSPGNPFEAAAQANKLAPPSEAERYYDEAMRIQGENPATRAYREHVATMPMREDYKPSGWRRLAAALAGGAIAYNEPERGLAAAMEFRDRPYAEALQNFAGKEKVLGSQADIEQDDINARLKALQNARAMGLKYDEFALKQLEAERRYEIDGANADTNRMRAEAYVKAQNRPDFTAHIQEDGSVLYVNKADPTITQLVPSKAIEAFNAQTQRQNANTNARNAETNVRRTNIYGESVRNAHERGNEALRLRRDGTNRPPLPDHQQDAEDMALRQLMTDPDFMDFIEEDDDGFPKLVEDDGSEAYQAFVEELNNRVSQILRGSPARPIVRR